MKTKPARFLRIAIIRTQRTDLPCAACGMFRTEFAILPASAREPMEDEEADTNTFVGVHRDCIEKLYFKRGS